MDWFLLSVISSVLTAASAITLKISAKNSPALHTYWLSSVLFGLPVLAIMADFSTLPLLIQSYLPELMMTGILNVAAMAFFNRAIDISEISLLAPLTALYSALSVVTSMIFLGEHISALGFLGIILAVIGVYVCALDKSKSIFAPIKSLYSERGPRFVVLVTLCWSISVIFDKRAIVAVDPTLWIFSLSFVVQLTFGVWFLIRRQNIFKTLKPMLKPIITLGFVSAGANLTYMKAVALVSVAYPIAIRQSNVVLVVIFGMLVLHEGNIRNRLTGASILVCSAAILAFS